MLGAFFGRFYREIILILNIVTIPIWGFISDSQPPWWKMVLFALGFTLELFTGGYIIMVLFEEDETWRQKWRNFCRFDRRSCKKCEFGEYCKHSTCQHKSLRNGRYYLLKILGH